MADSKLCQQQQRLVIEATSKDQLNEINDQSTSNHDANNNPGESVKTSATSARQESMMIADDSGCEQSHMSDNADFPEIGKQSNEISTKLNYHQTSSDSSCESDDWHLLDVDEQCSSDELVNNTESFSSKMKQLSTQNGVSNRIRMSPFKREKAACGDMTELKKKEYVDIDPLLNLNQAGYSQQLIYICTVLYSLVPLASTIALITLIYLALFTRYWWITVAYFTYLAVDRNTCNTGGRRIEFVYNSRFWSYLAAYFPIRLRYSREFNLDPSENYLLNYHPHGISAFGCVTAFATNGLNFKQLFPNITSRFMVHETSFNVPIMRDVFMTRGDCSVNSKSIDYILSKRWQTGKDGGNLLALVGGGLAEASLSEPDTLKIVVANRKGFVKKALIHGANLIPCIAFGENSVFTRVNFEPGSFMHRLETRWYSLFKFKHPIYYGTSIFTKNVKGALPYKRPITVVMGDPIMVERIESPSQEEIDDLHGRYLAELKELYVANSDLCSQFDRTVELV